MKPKSVLIRVGMSRDPRYRRGIEVYRQVLVPGSKYISSECTHLREKQRRVKQRG